MENCFKSVHLTKLSKVILCAIVGILLTLIQTEGARLSDGIRHYEPLSYDHTDLSRQHHRVRRTVSESINLDIHAFDREFKIRLQRDHSVVTTDIVIEDSHGDLDSDFDRAYIGYLENGDRDESIHGTISKEGHFQGKIKTKNGTYMIQHAHHFFKNDQPFHSVIYRDSDVDFDIGSVKCKSDQLKKYIRDSGDGLNEEEAVLKYEPHLQDMYHGYSMPNHRTKRAVDPNKNTCTMYLQADHTFYKKLGSSADRVTEEMIQYVQAINDIYPGVDVDKDSSADGIRFIIKRMKIHTDENANDYKFKGHFGVEKFLEMFSEDDHDEFCLAYIFTHRDFEDGVLGLAWTGDLVYAGGVCEKRGNFQGTQKSLNTGLVTTLNYQKDVPKSISHITFAHEVGHNMGSPHDPDETTCAPSDTNGNYIMYARATPGNKNNNKKLSSCSVDKIGPVVDKKARSTGGCFIDFPGKICGNKVKESDEECDCGWDDECTEGCCVPKSTNQGGGSPCTLKEVSNMCSPSAGPCCNSSCQYITAAQNVLCRDAENCTQAAYCDSANFNATCPPSEFKANSTSCADNKVCYNGECSSEAVCIAHGRQTCYCEPTKADDWNDEKLCHVCCIDPADNKCKSTFDTPAMQNYTAGSGTTCMNYRGYCDVFQECRNIDPEGPLSSLRQFLSMEALETMKEWLKKYWYAAVGAGVAFFILMGIFIKVCSKRKQHDNRICDVARR